MNSLTEWAVTGLDIENPWAMGIIQVTVKPLVISDWALVAGEISSRTGQGPWVATPKTIGFMQH